MSVKMRSVQGRRSKLKVEDLVPFPNPLFVPPLYNFEDRLPKVLAANSLIKVVDSIVYARKKKKPIIFCMGGHVIKCGLSPIVIELFRKGLITDILTNGSCVIHDVELAQFGETSEYVEEALPLGEFGLTWETHEVINKALEWGMKRGIGYGQAVGETLDSGYIPGYGYAKSGTPYRNISIFANCGSKTYVAVGIGTDIHHMGPADGAAIGESSLRDFRSFTSRLGECGGGGVIINFGSAVVLPEVILKGLGICQNRYHQIMGLYPELEESSDPLSETARVRRREYREDLKTKVGLHGMVAVNFDFIQSYRGNTRVVEGAKLVGGTGYSITGHHEIMLPLLAGMLLGRITKKKTGVLEDD